MTDAEKREKVIRGLEACNRLSYNGSDCQNCPYYDDEDTAELPFGICNIQDMFDDALSLLKEQAPRVMDADEVFVTELSTVLYLERRRARGTTRIVPAILMDHDTWSYGLLSSYRYAEFVHEGKLIDHRDLATYGVTWRCWTSRPSPEQMRETPWEGENDA